MSESRKFRKKPVLIEAMQWTGTHRSQMDIEAWAGRILARNGGLLLIPTLEREMMARSGDWIIRGLQGELYPCRADIFDSTYEPVRESPPHD